MKHVVKSVLLWYSPREMFDLVTAVQDYPRFLPWCESADVLEDHGDGVTARLGLHYMGVRHAFTTRNHNVPGERVSIELVDGPFSLLDGTWVFKPLARPGSDVSAFRTMSCSDRSVAAADLHQRLSALETRQRRTRTLDTVGVGLFLIPVGSLMGGNHEAEIGDFGVALEK